MNIFEQASRHRPLFRFPTAAGLLTVEDLWDLPLTHRTKINLDDIARQLSRELKESQDVSFVDASAKPNTLLQLGLDIVKHIIDVKLAERTATERAAATRARNARILGIIEQKEHAELTDKSIDDLKALLKESEA